MKIIKELEDLQPEMQNWRRDIHANPEIAFEEHRTAKIVADKLESFGIEVETGIAGTGVVGTLKKGKGNRSIGLRADLDALLINEINDFEHKSKTPGKMHACGHDGHTTMLLGAAKYLAEKISALQFSRVRKFFSKKKNRPLKKKKSENPKNNSIFF